MDPRVTDTMKGNDRNILQRVIYEQVRMRSNTERVDAGMVSLTRTVRIEWGDCDPAGIVFYPRYVAMFDHSTTLLIEQALGARKHELCRIYAFDGYPVVENRARFLKP